MNYKRQNYKLKTLLRGILDGTLHTCLMTDRNIIERAIKQPARRKVKTHLSKRQTLEKYWDLRKKRL